MENLLLLGTASSLVEHRSDAFQSATLAFKRRPSGQEDADWLVQVTWPPSVMSWRGDDFEAGSPAQPTKPAPVVFDGRRRKVARALFVCGKQGGDE